jgi:hypothetical protein
MGILARRLEEHPRPAAARREPSLQLSGRPGGREVDLPALQARGVGLAGRLTGVDGPRVRLAGDLAATTGEAGQRLRGLLRRIDAFAERTAITPEAGHAEPIREAQVTGGPLSWTCCTLGSARSSGPPATGGHTPGCTSPSSTTTGPSGTSAGPPPRRACTWPGCGGRPGGPPPSWTGSGTTPPWSSPRSLTTCVARLPAAGAKHERRTGRRGRGRREPRPRSGADRHRHQARP